ncbi:MAG: FAD-binding oxidoreductase [Planctomycetes bacterium]|nr:FAD-binding oxidoreductase [Planctomycetota bacterium]
MSSESPRFVERQLAGWGNYPVEPCRVYRPERRRDLDDILRSLADGGGIPRGLGRSYGDASLNRNGAVIGQDRLSCLRSFDEQAVVLECDGGTSNEEIIDAMLPRGYFLPVTPGTRYVTVGGAIASDVHGKNHHRDGSISAFVESFELLTASGEMLTCSRHENSDVFWATIGGMGLTGIIVSARIRLMPVETAYITMRTDRAKNLDEALERFAELDTGYRYSVAWLDCTAGRRALGRSVLMHGEHTARDELAPAEAHSPLSLTAKARRTVRFFAPRFALSPLTVRAFNRTYYARQRDGTRRVRLDSFMFPLDAVAHWNRLYGRRGFIQYQLVLPNHTAREGLVEILDRIVRAGAASFLSVLKRLGPLNDAHLSFPIEGWTLALDMPNTGAPLLELVRALETLTLKHEGRVYLTKDATLTRDAFEAMYPRLDEFKEIKRRLDPQQRFTSSMARRLGIVDGEAGR